jgi:arylsulfatase A-like enzyme
MNETIVRALREVIWRCLTTAGILAVLDLGMNGLTRGVYPRFGDNLALLGQSFTINLGFVTVLFVLTAVILTLAKRLTRDFRFWNNAKVTSAAGAVTAAALIFIFVSVHVNTAFISSSFSAAGLFANVVMFLLFFVFISTIFWADRRTVRWRRRLFWRVGTCVLVAVMVVLAVVYVFFPQATRLVRPDPPVGTSNFVIIVLDALRRDHVSAYNPQTAPETPNLDELAELGVKYELAFAPSTWTVPSMASMNNSQYPRVHRINLIQGAPDDVPALAEILAATGYDTRVITGNQILRRDLGFSKGYRDYEEYFGISELEAFHYSTLYFAVRLLRNKTNDFLGYRPDITTWCTERTTAYFEKRAQSDRPFFLWVHYLDPHGPLVPPVEYIPADAVHRDEALEFLADESEDLSRYTADKAEVTRILYYAEVRYVDAAVGRLWETVVETGLAENTIFIVTTDHGEELFERGKYNHGHTMYPELTHIPLLIYYPDYLDGKRRSDPVTLLDLAPTILDAAGLPVPETMEGESLLNVPKGRSPRIIYIEGTIDRPETDKALFAAPYYYIYGGPEGTGELYDVRDFNDPDELPAPVTDLYPEVAADLKSEMEKHLEYVEAKRAEFSEGAAVRIEKGAREKLRKLGYFN